MASIPPGFGVISIPLRLAAVIFLLKMTVTGASRLTSPAFEIGENPIIAKSPSIIPFPFPVNAI